jgi:H+/Cl- antiporter ClcA
VQPKPVLDHPGTDAAPVPGSAVRWWFAVLATGACAGVVGIGLTLLLHLVQHLAFGYTENTFLYGVTRASPARRVEVLAVGGLVAGIGWWLLRRWATVHSVDAAISAKAGPLPVISTTVDSVLQVVVVGLGASLGREGAPRQAAAAVAAWLAQRCRLDAEQRRVLIAAGAGAGLAAVYNVPLSGCVFAAEVLLGSFTPRVLLPAAVASAVATGVSWLALPDVPTYAVGSFRLTGSLVVWSVLAGPVLGLAGWGFRLLMRRAREITPKSWRLIVATTLAFTALGLLAIPFPELLGDGKGPTQLALTGPLALGTAAALVLLKPAVTAACLRSGANGGLLTPSLATGALLGATAGMAWSLLWPGTAVGAFALVGAAAMLAVTQRSPLCAVVLTIELTHAGLTLLVPMLLTVILAVLIDRAIENRPAARPAGLPGA